MQKMKLDYVHCPMTEVVLEDIIKIVWTEQCGNLKEMRYLGKAALVYPG